MLQGHIQAAGERGQPPTPGPQEGGICIQEPLKNKWDSLQKQQIVVPLDVEETLKSYNVFSCCPKANGKVQLCLDQITLNKVLIRLVHKRPTLYDILPRLAGIMYVILTDASSGYHNQKLDEQSSHLTTFSCPFGRYRYI